MPFLPNPSQRNFEIQCPRLEIVDWFAVILAGFPPGIFFLTGIMEYESISSSHVGKWVIGLVAVIPLLVLMFVFVLARRHGIPRDVNLKLVEAGAGGVLAFVLFGISSLDPVATDAVFQCKALATNVAAVDISTCTEAKPPLHPIAAIGISLVVVASLLKYVTAGWEMVLSKYSDKKR
ncbi:hypothetical protein [Corynebacterium suicordis]|uniref:Uncharacterized protein n=1 Tax=Corynebacterium suicordis DSM 45110 TaxID=1121369 RepID=A0ABR9ZLX2_9CORY|nr:hypothetical protein [Corynebacterium suicordis]MBF4554395.1 hypothetical protein [Corynebacterium suicordis DSM 45110]MDR6278580.1 hypothetical protein [Corynebacterium suicordis]